MKKATAPAPAPKTLTRKLIPRTVVPNQPPKTDELELINQDLNTGTRKLTPKTVIPAQTDPPTGGGAPLRVARGALASSGTRSGAPSVRASQSPKTDDLELIKQDLNSVIEKEVFLQNENKELKQQIQSISDMVNNLKVQLDSHLLDHNKTTSPNVKKSNTKTESTQSMSPKESNILHMLKIYKPQYKAKACKKCGSCKKAIKGKCGKCGEEVTYQLTIPNLSYDKLVEYLIQFESYFQTSSDATAHAVNHNDESSDSN